MSFLCLNFRTQFCHSKSASRYFDCFAGFQEINGQSPHPKIGYLSSMMILENRATLQNILLTVAR